jgi:hypothetical protein
MDKLINEAYQKVPGIYDDKGAGFIHHLIAAFLPVDKTLFNLLMETSETCCIVGLPSANGEMRDDLVVLQMTRMKANLGNVGAKTAAIELLNIFVRKYKIRESETIDCRAVYGSPKSDKVISKVALIALHNFAFDRIFSDAKIMGTINHL